MTNPLEYSFPSNQQKITQYDSHSSCSESPLDSPAGSNVPPSVQQTCSQLIKAGLKLSLEMKRKLSSGDSSGTEYKIAKKELMDSSDEDDDMDSKSPKSGLTPEDEDRRRRRRERNKIAATKCRMKKRERTLNLVSESEILETQNIELKSQVRSLETERRKLTEMLQAHGATCIRQEGFQPPSRCTIPISKYVPDLLACDQQSHRSPPNKTIPPIPPMNTIKFCHNLKPSSQNSEHSQPLPDIGYCKSDLSPMYCKSSPSDRYTLSPDSGFIKSPSDMGMYNGMHMKSDYIPNGENNDSDVKLLMDGTETQFTDLDSGVTTYNSIANNANNNSNNSGCMA
ncbi:Activating transcription factor 3, partial [Pseudolycoriella hygida]